MEAQHPLYSPKKFAEWYYSEEFPVSELAKWMDKPEYQVRRLIVQLAIKGFVFYNPETGDVTIKKELYKYLNAFAGKIDYDVMSFLSRTHAPVDNAVINLNNYNMTINGVPVIFLSDSQNVVIYPENHRIIMHRNRNFSFNGEIQAGMTTFNGKNFFFDYDSFKIDLHKIDSMRLTAYGDKTDNLGNPLPEKIRNTLEVITGELYIDAPDNKSGLKHYDQYPYFRSTDSSFVFYDKSSIYDSIYARKDFYFVIEPFTLYSISNLYKKDLSFKGDLISGNIFPAIPQQLKVQEDNSLGFISKAPEEGYPVYNGKGMYYNDVKLSNHGVEGAGKLIYLSSTAMADNFTFFPDSMITDVHDFKIEATHKGTKYPSVKAKDVKIIWYPQEDQYYIHRTTSDFTIFDERYRLNGDMTLTTAGLTARGIFILPGATVSSSSFSYGDVYVNADTSSLVITATKRGHEVRLQAHPMKAHLNIEQQTASFQTLLDTLHIEFPDKQYVTSLDRMTWDMTCHQIGLTNSRTTDDPYILNNDPYALTGKWVKMPTFISLNPKTDTLGFHADSALFDLSSDIIKTYRVEFLEVADALVYPNQQQLQIEKNGNLHQLTHAKLIARNRYQLDSVTLAIFTKNDFYGSGIYHYKQNNGEVENIFFNNISVDDSIHTYGKAELPPERHFNLSPDFEFRGKVELFDTRDYLYFTGGVRIKHHCDGISRNYLAFSSEINPSEVMIPVGKAPRDINHIKVFNGNFITSDSTHIYPAFLSGRKNYSDIPISTADGVLYFDKRSGEYRIGNEQKVLDPSLPGNYLAFNCNYCKLYGEGVLNPGVNFGQMKIVTAGNILQDIDSNSVTLHLMIGLDFFFLPEAMKIMTGEIDSLTSLKPIDIRSKEYSKILSEFIEPQKAQQINQEMKLFGQIPSVPKELKHTIFLSKVDLIWNTETSSYVSTGKIGIGNIDGYPLNVLVDGFLEIQKKRSGDMLDLYLKMNDKSWYYFGYTRGIMQALSSNRKFLDSFEYLKVNARKLKVKSGEIPYTYMVAVNRKLQMFLRRMRLLWENKAEEENRGF